MAKSPNSLWERFRGGQPGGNKPTSATAQMVQRQQEALQANQLMDAILQCQETMDQQNIPHEHREIYMTPDQFSALRHTLGNGMSATQGQIQSVTGAGRREVAQVMGMPIHVAGHEEKQPIPFAQTELDELAGILTEAVLLLRAGDERGAMAKLGTADQACEVRITPRYYPEDRTASEIRAKHNSVMYGKSMVSMLEGMNQMSSSLQRSLVDGLIQDKLVASPQINQYMRDALTYGKAGMNIVPDEMNIKDIT